MSTAQVNQNSKSNVASLRLLESSTGVAINSRFRGQTLTGVQRYAHEIVSRLSLPLSQLGPDASRAAGLRGHIWEQLRLPKLVQASQILWSPCNTGPLSVRNQVVTIHDLAFIDRPQDFSRAFAHWYRWLIPRLARRCRLILTVSEYSKERICEALAIPSEKVKVVPNGVSDRFYPASQEAIASVHREFSLATPYVVALGSLGPRKNLSCLFKAWRRVERQLAGTQLVVVGEASRIFQSVDGIADVPDSVRFLGRISDDSLVPLLSGADAFVFPSLYEGFGLPPLEAMATGCPTICSNSTSLPEVVGEAALTFCPTKPRQLEELLVQVTQDAGVRFELRHRGLKQSKRFHWDKSAEQVHGILAALT